MEELKWMYPAIDREDFQKRVTYAEKLLEKYGAEYVCDYDEKALWMLKDGTHAYENVHKRVYRLNNEYIRVDRVFFTKKPFIVLYVTGFAIILVIAIVFDFIEKKRREKLKADSSDNNE